MGLGNGLFLLFLLLQWTGLSSRSPPLRLNPTPVTSNESTGRVEFKETVNKWPI